MASFPPFDPPGTSRLRVGVFLLALPLAILLIAALFSGAENFIMVLVFGIPSAGVLLVTWGYARRLLYAVERIAYPQQPEPASAAQPAQGAPQPQQPAEHYVDPRYAQPSVADQHTQPMPPAPGR